ncbi:cyclase family protein [Brevibacillus sp. B_LB10_24]|uniref:cyclase family protein n=1 Tax=Brevibacillus sp. B_LB10_24 TaxID=3380645 RepID=UPI0038BC87BE
MSTDNDAVQTFLRLFHSFTVYDISPLFEHNMPGWPTHDKLGVITNARNFDQNGYYAQTLVMSEHTGSHVDAPRHNFPELATIDDFPADYLIGPYKKYDLSAYNPQPGEPVTLQIIKEVERKENFSPNQGDIVLLDFGWDQYYKPESTNPKERTWWEKNEPGLTEEVCRYFCEAGIKAIGADTAAVDISVKDGVVTSAYGHRKYFLPKNILIMEGFHNMDKAPATGIFLAIPLKIKAGSGSPIRPFLLG